ncbi:hypothetical protein GY31_15180 [Lysinibacillus sphaericus]|uniref:hypothetical protein n=1 Tax=Lysinibacillus TaxID=400634 RepID=UPI00084B11F6|nr:hypothetical protein [Lysinibacillus sphaericus]OEC01118.1 hypothetical protein GY31_15180 [Lysinibacillus sphaericus]
MAKITRISTPQAQIVDVIEQVLELAKNGELKNIALAAEHSSNGEVLTGYAGADVSERQYLLSHIQSDITMAIVAENIEEI